MQFDIKDSALATNIPEGPAPTTETTVDGPTNFLQVKAHAKLKHLIC
jgi:hypothetical protein